MGRAFVDGRPAHLRDVLAERDYDVQTRDVLQSVAGYRVVPWSTDPRRGQTDRRHWMRTA